MKKRNNKYALMVEETPKMDDLDDVFNDVEAVDNRIYFYSEVNRESILSLNKSLKEADHTVAVNSLKWSSSPFPIYLHINSFGGDLLAGVAAVDYIRRTNAPVYTVIDGCAASAATLISIVGKKRLINKHSYMLIHQLSTWFGGTYEHIKDEKENTDKFMKMIYRLYEEHTKIPKKELKQILKRDIWFDAKTCLRYGLVDEILD